MKPDPAQATSILVCFPYLVKKETALAAHASLTEAAIGPKAHRTETAA